MQKRNKILGFALFAVAFATWGVLFSAFKGSSLTLFPNCGYEIYALTDETAGGFSTSDISIGDSAISAQINIRSGKAYPYAGIGFNLTSLNSRPIGPFDFSRFDTPDKILAYAGLSPSTYESGKLKATGAYAHMEKRGSRYLRYALFNAAKYVCIWEPSFAAYLAKKRAEGKHYNVAISHAAKKLVRLVFALQTTGRAFQPS